MKYISGLAFGLFLLTSCGESNQGEPTTDLPEAPVQEPTTPACMYQYNNDRTIVNWTGFKHGAKVPVSGKFESFTASGYQPAEEPQEAVVGTAFAIDINSINSEDPARDAKLKEFFFGAMNGTDSITGMVKSVTGNDIKGTGVVMIKMNGLEKETPFTYALSDDQKFTMKLSIDILNWEAADALASINKACEEKHTGEGDTEAVTHSDFDIVVSTKLDKMCE